MALPRGGVCVTDTTIRIFFSAWRGRTGDDARRVMFGGLAHEQALAWRARLTAMAGFSD